MPGLMIRCASCGNTAEKKLFGVPPDGWINVMMSTTDDFKNPDNSGWGLPACALCEKCSEPIKQMFAPLVQKRRRVQEEK